MLRQFLPQGFGPHAFHIEIWHLNVEDPGYLGCDVMSLSEQSLMFWMIKSLWITANCLPCDTASHLTRRGHPQTLLWEPHTMRSWWHTKTGLKTNFGPYLGAKARFLSMNRTQSRAVTGILTRHNTLRRHLHLMVLSDSPLYRRCGVQDETSAHILCEGEAFASLKYVYLGSSSLEPQDMKSINLGAIWNFSKATGLP